MFKLHYVSVSLQYSSLHLHWVNHCSSGERYKWKESGTAYTHNNMAATLSMDDETQLKELLDKLGLKVDEVKTIEGLMKMLPKVKREKKTAKKMKFFFGAYDEVSSDEDEDDEEKGAKAVSKLMILKNHTCPQGTLIL